MAAWPSAFGRFQAGPVLGFSLINEERIGLQTLDKLGLDQSNLQVILKESVSRRIYAHLECETMHGVKRSEPVFRYDPKTFERGFLA